MHERTREMLELDEDGLNTAAQVEQQLHASRVVSPDMVHPLNMDDLLDRFEDKHHSLPDSFTDDCRGVWAEMGVSLEPDGDDVKTMAAVETFARLYVNHYDATIPHASSEPAQSPSHPLTFALSNLRSRIGI